MRLELGITDVICRADGQDLLFSDAFCIVHATNDQVQGGGWMVTFLDAFRSGFNDSCGQIYQGHGKIDACSRESYECEYFRAALVFLEGEGRGSGCDLLEAFAYKFVRTRRVLAVEAS